MTTSRNGLFGNSRKEVGDNGYAVTQENNQQNQRPQNHVIDHSVSDRSYLKGYRGYNEEIEPTCCGFLLRRLR